VSHARFSGFRFWKLSPIAFKCAVLELCVNDDALNLLHVLLSPHLKLNYCSDTSWDELRMFDMKTAQRRQRRCKRHALENTGATTANSLAPLRILDRPSGQHVPKRFTVQKIGMDRDATGWLTMSTCLKSRARHFGLAGELPRQSSLARCRENNLLGFPEYFPWGPDLLDAPITIVLIFINSAAPATQYGVSRINTVL